MCLDRRSMPRKARIFLAIGNLCLFTGLSLTLFNHDFAAHHSSGFDFARGFLMGLAITFNLAAVVISRNNRPANLLTR